jgi:hypothetical protein
LHPKFYSPIFFWDVESSSNYAEKLKLTGIAATTLDELKINCCHDFKSGNFVFFGHFSGPMFSFLAICSQLATEKLLWLIAKEDFIFLNAK